MQWALFWRTYGALIRAVAFPLLLFGGGFFAGFQHERKNKLLEVSEIRTEQLTNQNKAISLVMAANAAIRKQEEDHRRETQSIVATYLAEKRAQANKTERLLADARSGAFRLRLPVTSCSRGLAGPAEGWPSPGRVDGEATAELGGEVSAEILGLLAEGDAAIHQLTALQLYVVKLEATVNGATK